MKEENLNRLDEIKTNLSLADELQRDDCDYIIEQLTAAQQENVKLKSDMLNWASETESLRDKLAESQQREAELREMIIENGHDHDYEAGKCWHTCAACKLESTTPPPSVAMVPWEVVRAALEQFELCYDDATSYGPGEADADYKAAIDSLKAYAPQPKEKQV